MPRIPGVNHRQAVRALTKIGFYIARESKHIVMTNGKRILTVPRKDPIDVFAMGGILKDAGLDVEEFR